MVGVSHAYGSRWLFEDINLSVQAGESIAILGESGVGKSTLLGICGLLLRPTHGEISVRGEKPSSRDRSRSRIRRDSIGFIFQSFHLHPRLTALENVATGVGGHRSRASVLSIANQALAKVGIQGFANSMPSEMSGGERQRVAIARALAKHPQLILADEPTGNLDDTNSDLVLSLMLEAVRDTGAALLLVTHNTTVASQLDRGVLLTRAGLAESKPT